MKTRTGFLIIVFGFLLATVVIAKEKIVENKVVVTVNGVALMASELDAAIDQIIPQATYHGGITEEKREEFREQALQDLITRELQYQDAVARGMKPDKKMVAALMKQIRDGFESKKAYKKALEQAGITEDGLQQITEKGVLVKDVIAKTVTEPSQITDAELKSYYDKNIAKFKQPESVSLRLISCSNETKAKEALSKIRAGEDFGNVAAQFSEDKYRIMGGNIGSIHRGRIYPEIENAAFKLKIGEMSDIIKSEGMWAIIKVEGKQNEKQLTFEESKDKLKKDLTKKRTEELKEKWMNDLRAKAKIEVISKDIAQDKK